MTTQRYAMAVRLKNEKREYYIENHANVWPEVLNELKKIKIKNFDQKKYTKSLKKEKEIPLYEEPVTEFKKSNKKKKSTTNGLQPLLLQEEEPKTEVPKQEAKKEEQKESILVLNDEYKKNIVQASETKRAVSPSARKLAQEKNINLGRVKGSGKHGLVLKGDLLDLMDSKPILNKRKMCKVWTMLKLKNLPYGTKKENTDYTMGQKIYRVHIR